MEGVVMAELVELTDDESWELARSQPFCRVAWTSPTGPTVIPLNHVVDGRTLWFRTSAYSELVREVDDTRAAVLVDEIDTSTRLGWSVQLRGVAHVHWHVDEVPEQVRSLHTWASGSRPLWIELAPDEVHGRRLVAGD
jgi:nitroimidazol reductase NimA-like FMN-containing flavoprotein (pyridoxamine 5'-phosphate oxidase superfamily)